MRENFRARPDSQDNATVLSILTNKISIEEKDTLYYLVM